jgi:hypothetical protein
MSGRSAGGKYKIFKTCMVVMFKSMVKTRVAVRSHLKSSSVVTGGNWSTRCNWKQYSHLQLEGEILSDNLVLQESNPGHRGKRRTTPHSPNGYKSTI